MERIKDSFDDLNNKARPGVTWVSGFNVPGRTDNLRSIDIDGSQMQFEPNSRYYASCTIRRGEAVSIAQLQDLSDDLKGDKFAYVKIADPDIDETCLGIATNYAEPGQIVHIQRHGKFNYLTTDSLLCTEERQKKEVFLKTTGWDFDIVRGQRIFLKKKYDHITQNGENTRDVPVDENGDTFDTDHIDRNKEILKDTADWFTYDYMDSVYNARNTIQIGYLVDAPITSKTRTSYKKVGDKWQDYKGNEVQATLVHIDGDQILDENNELAKKPSPTWNLWLQEIQEDGVTKYVAVDEQVISVELEVTGDTRGPLDNTQFVVTLGESVYFNPIKQDLELTTSHLNQGVFEEVKVLAINKEPKQSPTFRVFQKSEIPEGLEETFIAIRKLDGNTYILPIHWENPDLNTLTQPGDRGYIALSKQFTQSREVAKPNGELITWAPKLEIAPNLTGEITSEVLQTELKKALDFVFQDTETLEFGADAKTIQLGTNGFILTTNKVGGFYDIYVSEPLLKYISATNVQPGNDAEPGTAVLADIRNTSRINVVGVCLSNQNGVHKRGETVKVMTLGRMTTLGNLEKGTKYYLGMNGRITAKSVYWYDHCIPVGTAESANTLLVDIVKEPVHSYSGNFPLGYLKPSVKGFTEDGFCSADGVTKYSKEEFPELYNSLLNWFSEEELKPSNVTQKSFEDLYNKELVSQYTYLPIYIKNILEKIEEIKVDTDYVMDIVPQLEQKVDGFEFTLEDLSDDLTKFLEDFSSYKIQVQEEQESQNTRLTNLETGLELVQGVLKNQDESLQSIETKVDTQTVSITELQQVIVNLNSIIENQSDTLTDQSTKIINLESTIQNQLSQITKMGETIMEQTNQIEGMEDTITNLNGTVESLQSKIDKQTLEINNLYKMVEALKEAIGDKPTDPEPTEPTPSTGEDNSEEEIPTPGSGETDDSENEETPGGTENESGTDTPDEGETEEPEKKEDENVNPEPNEGEEGSDESGEEVKDPETPDGEEETSNGEEPKPEVKDDEPEKEVVENEPENPDEDVETETKEEGVPDTPENPVVEDSKDEE